MMSPKLFFLFTIFLSQPVGALTLDWKGFSRIESYYEQSDKKAYYGNLHLVLKPEIQVLDGLSVFSRLDLYPFSASGESPYSSGDRQTGSVFFSSQKSATNKTEDSLPLLLNLSQIYLTYETEFFKFKLGKAPYHFGLGITYSAETSPFDHWISHFNQMAFYFEYTSFYVELGLIQFPSKGILSLNQIGFSADDWKLEALLQYNLETKKSYLETFGIYKQGLIDAKASLGYFFGDDVASSSPFIFAMEAAMDLPINLSPQLGIKAGYVPAGVFLHPNYDVTLLKHNRFIGYEVTNPIQIAEERIKHAIYISPYLSLGFLNNKWIITPSMNAVSDLLDYSSDYEINLQASYHPEENFSLLVQGGILFHAFDAPGQNDVHKKYYGFLAQAAVTF